MGAVELEQDIVHFKSLLRFIEDQKLPRVVADYCVDLAEYREELAEVCNEFFDKIDGATPEPPKKRGVDE